MKDASPGRLDLSVSSRDGVAVVSVVGEVDLANCDELESALSSEPCRSSERVVLDLLGVPFMDSSGLRILLMSARSESASVSVVLSPGSPVLRLLEIAEMTDVVPIYATEEEALQAVDSRAAD